MTTDRRQSIPTPAEGAAWVALAVGEGSSELPSGAAHLLAHMRRVAPGLWSEPDGSTRIRVALRSRVDADALTETLCEWAAGADKRWALIVAAGSAWSAHRRATLYQVGGRLAAEWLGWLIAVASGFAKDVRVRLDERHTPYAG